MQFQEVVGHSEIKQHLIEEITNDKVSHAQLFLGKAGYGSLPMALAFVQYLFCENKQETDSCGQCASCKKVQDYQHPDLHFSYPTVLGISKLSTPLLKEWREQLKANPYFKLKDWVNKIDSKGRKPTIGTDESQDILKRLSLKSFEGGYKVMIIWMAEEMNTQSGNRLLKILEEPPARTLFILVCESQDAVLKTILSRTQIVKIPRIETEALSAYLRTNNQLNQSNADSVAGRCEGDLLEALDFIGDHQEQDENRELFIELMRVCFKKDVLQMMNWADKVASLTKERQRNFMKYSLHMIRQSMLKNYTEDILLRASEEERSFLQKFARFITGNNVMDFMKTFNDGDYYIERNANSRLLFTNICFKVMRYIHVA